MSRPDRIIGLGRPPWPTSKTGSVSGGSDLYSRADGGNRAQRGRTMTREESAPSRQSLSRSRRVASKTFVRSPVSTDLMVISAGTWECLRGAGRRGSRRCAKRPVVANDRFAMMSDRPSRISSRPTARPPALRPSHICSGYAAVFFPRALAGHICLWPANLTTRFRLTSPQPQRSTSFGLYSGDA